jgi:hypothetical protein
MGRNRLSGVIPNPEDRLSRADRRPIGQNLSAEVLGGSKSCGLARMSLWEIVALNSRSGLMRDAFAPYPRLGSVTRLPRTPGNQVPSTSSTKSMFPRVA